MSLLFAASHSGRETRWAFSGRDEGVEGWRLFWIWCERAGRASLCGEIDADSGRSARWGFRGTQEAFFGGEDRRSAHADRVGEFDESGYGATGAGAGVSGRNNLATRGFFFRPLRG